MIYREKILYMKNDLLVTKINEGKRFKIFKYYNIKKESL